METINLLRNTAKENIMKYCIQNNCENEYDDFEKELLRQADEFNLLLPLDFYKEFYNKSLTLLNEGKI